MYFSAYVEPRFLYFLDNIKSIVEIGSRYGRDSLQLAETFPEAVVHAFECNPETITECFQNVSKCSRIQFVAAAASSTTGTTKFWSYICSNYTNDPTPGLSSVQKRVDHHMYTARQVTVGTIALRDYLCCNVDLLCMDTQGHELECLRGLFPLYSRFVIMEEPKPGVDSRYISAPSSQEIKTFMNSHGYTELVRIEENLLEDNVMYKRMD